MARPSGDLTADWSDVLSAIVVQGGDQAIDIARSNQVLSETGVDADITWPTDGTDGKAAQFVDGSDAYLSSPDLGNALAALGDTDFTLMLYCEGLVADQTATERFYLSSGSWASRDLIQLRRASSEDVRGHVRVGLAGAGDETQSQTAAIAGTVHTSKQLITIEWDADAVDASTGTQTVTVYDYNTAAVIATASTNKTKASLYDRENVAQDEFFLGGFLGAAMPMRAYYMVAMDRLRTAGEITAVQADPWDWASGVAVNPTIRIRAKSDAAGTVDFADTTNIQVGFYDAPFGTELYQSDTAAIVSGILYVDDDLVGALASTPFGVIYKADEIGVCGVFTVVDGDASPTEYSD